MAQTWRSQWLGVAYMLPLGFAVRFLHFALSGKDDASQATLCFVALVMAALAGFAVARRSQMARQYPWLSENYFLDF